MFLKGSEKRMGKLNWSCPYCRNPIDGEFISECQKAYEKLQKRKLRKQTYKVIE
jgi:hypothetical protein